MSKLSPNCLLDLDSTSTVHFNLTTDSSGTSSKGLIFHWESTTSVILFYHSLAFIEFLLQRHLLLSICPAYTKSYPQSSSVHWSVCTVSPTTCIPIQTPNLDRILQTSPFIQPTQHECHPPYLQPLFGTFCALSKIGGPRRYKNSAPGLRSATTGRSKRREYFHLIPINSVPEITNTEPSWIFRKGDIRAWEMMWMGGSGSVTSSLRCNGIMRLTLAYNDRLVAVL